MRLGRVLAGVTFAMCVGVTCGAQSPQGTEKAPEKPPTAESAARIQRSEMYRTAPTQTFYLKYMSGPNSGNEILTGLRLMLDPAVKIYLDPGQNAIIIRALPEDLALASRLIGELDRPQKTFRLTYTVTEMDGGKRVGTQHYALTAVTGKRTTLKEGSKVPIATGSYSDGSKSATGMQTQFTYLDVGMNFDVTLTETAGGAQLISKVEESSVAEDRTIAGVQEPVIRQTVLEGVSVLVSGKPLVLGSLDMPGSTHRLDVEVMVEPVP